MNWIETIELRANEKANITDKIDVFKLANTVKNTPKPFRVQILENGMVGTDYCIQLWYNTETVAQYGSELGTRLAIMLREMGLVSHKIWIEKQSYKIETT